MQSADATSSIWCPERTLWGIVAHIIACYSLEQEINGAPQPTTSAMHGFVKVKFYELDAQVLWAWIVRSFWFESSGLLLLHTRYSGRLRDHL